MTAHTDDASSWGVWARSAPEPLSPAHCRSLLGSSSIGRLAWRAADGLQLLPVSYVPYRDGVAFRTSPYGLLSDLVQPTEVVFEVDKLDPDSRTGWSVVLRGRAQAVAEPRELVELWTIDGLTPWAPGVRNLFIQITTQVITGRVFAAPREPL